MRKLLVINAFEKAKNTVHTDVVSQLSTHISDVLLSDYKYLVNERTLRNYYNEAIDCKDGDIRISRQNELHLSKYLGYEHYGDFLLKNGLTKQKNKRANHTLSISVFIVVILLGYSIFSNKKENCMVWTNNDHYEKMNCNDNKEDIANKALDLKTLEHLKRVNPECDYPFFKIDGSTNLWYEKDMNGTLEYFTYHGLHPVTGKTLKPITEYMVKKYICVSH